MIFAIIFFVLLASFVEAKAKKVFHIQREDNSFIDYYILKYSERTASDTLLLILQGSSCNNVIHKKKMKEVALAWPKADILLVEKYGIGAELLQQKGAERKSCPAAFLEMDSPEQRVSDILQVLSKVSVLTEYKNYLMIVGSEGAVVSNMSLLALV